jgi:hypothetical protein
LGKRPHRVTHPAFFELSVKGLLVKGASFGFSFAHGHEGFGDKFQIFLVHFLLE